MAFKKTTTSEKIRPILVEEPCVKCGSKTAGTAGICVTCRASSPGHP